MSIDVKNNHLRYCPFCGNAFAVQLSSIRFCSFCGENLAALPGLTSEKTIDGYATAGGNPGKQVDGTSVKQEFLADQDQRESNMDGCITAAQTAISLENNVYSLVLKYCFIDRQVLVRKLQTILLRSSRAIQLALESVPCVILYKEKAEKLLNVLAVCQETGAAAILFANEVNVEPHINEIYRGFAKLPDDLQIFLQSFPHKLWIGENIAGVYTVQTQDKGSGALVVGEHALYFVGRQYDWLVVSYLQVQAVYESSDALEIEYQGGQPAEVFYFSDKHSLEQAFAQLRQAWELNRRRWQVETHCVQCGVHNREMLFNTKQVKCPQCGQQLVRKIINCKG